MAVDTREKSNTCKDCGTGYCQHGRQKSTCKQDCSAPEQLLPARAPGAASAGARTAARATEHGLQKSTCSDYGTQKSTCKDCKNRQ